VLASPRSRVVSPESDAGPARPEVVWPGLVDLDVDDLADRQATRNENESVHFRRMPTGTPDGDRFAATRFVFDLAHRLDQDVLPGPDERPILPQADTLLHLH
jgi:hypothetical protein